MKREETALTPIGANLGADHQLDIRDLEALATGSESNLFKDALAESGKVAAEYQGQVDALSRKQEEDLAFNQSVDTRKTELEGEFKSGNETIWGKTYEGWDGRAISRLDTSNIAKTILRMLFKHREEVNQIIDSIPENHRTPSVIISKLFENNNEILNEIAENYHTDPSHLEPELVWLLNIAAFKGAANIYYTDSQNFHCRQYYGGAPDVYIPRRSYSLKELVESARTSSNSDISHYFHYKDFFQTKKVRKFMVDFLVGGFTFNTRVENYNELMDTLFKVGESKVLRSRIDRQVRECEETRKTIREETYVARLPRLRIPGKGTKSHERRPNRGRPIVDVPPLVEGAVEIFEGGGYATLDKEQFPLVHRELTRAIHTEATESRKPHPLTHELTGINAEAVREQVDFYIRNRNKWRFFMGAETERRLGALEAAEMQKPDEYAVMLANLYRFVHFFFTLGTTLYQKGATTDQIDQGFNYICFAVGLSRVLERMVAMLETRLAVKETIGNFEMDDFVELAEAVDVLSKNPLEKANQGFITDMMGKFRVAIEVQAAEGE